MALDFSPDALIRGGSGFVLMAVGVVILLLAGRARAGRALAGYCIAFGTGFIVINFLGDDLLSIGLWARGLTSFAAAGFLLWFHQASPWRARVMRRVEWMAAAVALFAGILAEASSAIPSHLVVSQIGGYDDPLAAQVTNLAGVVLFSAATFVALCAASATRSGRHVRAATLLTIGVLAYHAYVAFGLAVNPLMEALPADGFGDLGPMMAAIVIVGAVWLRTDPWPAWGLFGAGLASMVATTWWPGFIGDVGIVRCLAAILVAVAVVRHDLLGVPLAAPKVRRGAVATGALALLFIVAQVAQNFFSAQYGLLTGGVVAGAFLFAANPIQKRIERAGEGKSHTRPTAAAPQAEAAFRNAVALAYKDRRFTHKEELALADLAEQLGLGARRATEIRHEIEGRTAT